jgi:hypothetical protein
VNEAERLRRVPLEPRDHLRYRRQMSVPIALDEGTEDKPPERIHHCLFALAPKGGSATLAQWDG